MTPNENTIHKFYTAFANANASQMCECYHPEIQFQDPAFGILKGKEVCQMWKMLLERSKGDLTIEYSEIKVKENTGSAFWIARYSFSKTNRKIVNSVATKFHFKEGLIIKQFDDFDLWKWSKQAFGLIGLLLGWTGFFQKKIQKQARLSLKNHFKAKEI